MRCVAVLAVLTLAVAGCSTDIPAGTFGAAADPPDEATALYRGVEYYPACGNEVLVDDHGTYYPFTPDASAGFPLDPLDDAAVAGLTPLVADAASEATGVAWTAAQVSLTTGVPAPGAGDGVGTLVVYDAGRTAYWVSESGTLSTWLTGRPLTYNWVC